MGVDVAACRAAFAQAELGRRMVEGWGLSRAGVAAVCAAAAARPPDAAEGAAARLLGAPAVVTATPVPPLPLPLARRGSEARHQCLASRFVVTAELEE